MTIVDEILTEYRTATNLERNAKDAISKHAARRGELIRMLQGAGWTNVQIAKAVNLTPQRIGQLAKR